MIKFFFNYVFLISIGYSISVTSGGELSKNQLGIDIKHYDIRLKVDTKRKMLSGYVDIKMKIEETIRFIELDLIKQYFISKVLGRETPEIKYRLAPLCQGRKRTEALRRCLSLPSLTVSFSQSLPPSRKGPRFSERRCPACVHCPS